ncbi:MAG: hypothetical protein R3337_00415 [Gammaproteobacteria bacterium]|nr:hypothetical protein [Gammaproteobacteria bacterium]
MSKPTKDDGPDNSGNTPPTKAKAGPVTRTPDEWAEKLRLSVKTKVRAPDTTNPVHPFHAAAVVKHGWIDENGFPVEVQLTEDDYRKALKAAADGPISPPYKPATTRCCPVKDGAPLKKRAKLSKGEEAQRKKAARRNHRMFAQLTEVS